MTDDSGRVRVNRAVEVQGVVAIVRDHAVREGDPEHFKLEDLDRGTTIGWVTLDDLIELRGALAELIEHESKRPEWKVPDDPFLDTTEPRPVPS